MKMDVESLRHDYSEAANSYRHFSGLRFVIVSVYVAVIGALGGVALGVVGTPQPQINIVQIAAAAALVVTACFFTCEIACDRSRRHFISIMCELELTLGYSTMTRFPMPPPFKASWAFRVLYSFNLALWTWLAVHGEI